MVAAVSGERRSWLSDLMKRSSMTFSACRFSLRAMAELRCCSMWPTRELALSRAPTVASTSSGLIGWVR